MKLKIFWEADGWKAQELPEDRVWWEEEDVVALTGCGLPQNTDQVKALITLACKALGLDVAKATKSFAVDLVDWVCPNLDALYEAMSLDCLPEPLRSWEGLPTFGGDKPDIPNVWSWDTTRMIVGGVDDVIRIVDRVL